MADTIFSTQFAEGAAKAKQIVAPGSLGRLSTDPAIQAALEQQKKLAQGMSSQEMQAKREMAGQEINRATQTESRALQAQLARAGVKGGVAGSQLRDVALGGLAQKANVEKQLMAEDRSAQEKSLSNYLNSLGQTQQFDISQTQAEKNIELQTGLAFSGMGSSERASALMAGATTRAAELQAQAQQGGGSSGILSAAGGIAGVTLNPIKKVLGIGGSVVCTELYRQGIIPKNVWVKNTSYGANLYKNDRYTYYGYLSWGLPAVNILRKKSILSKLLKPFMLKWVDYLGGKRSVSNTVAWNIAIGSSKIIGKLIKFKMFVKDLYRLESRN